MSSEITPRQAIAAIGTLGAGAIAALAMAVSTLKVDEGKRNVSYRDIAGIPTSCYGHTGPDVRVGQRKTDRECEQLLERDARQHLQGVLRCSPRLDGRPYQLAAMTRFAFNVGVAGYCGSTAARRINAGNLRGGCDALMMWTKARVNGQLVDVRGLVNRRSSERAMCLTGL